MNTIGQILKDARVKKDFSLKHVEGLTKIKSSFIEAIESENWNVLPAFPTVLGFVKSISTTLNIDDKMAVAVLKRDYPPQKLSINPKPDVSSKFFWNPKLTFFVGITAAILVIIGYLGFQYFQFISPPNLNVESPKEGQVVTDRNLLVFGSTEIDAKLSVNNQPVILDADGKFSVSIPVSAETKEVAVTAVSRSGKSTTISRKIEVQ